MFEILVIVSYQFTLQNGYSYTPGLFHHPTCIQSDLQPVGNLIALTREDFMFW